MPGGATLGTGGVARASCDIIERYGTRTTGNLFPHIQHESVLENLVGALCTARAISAKSCLLTSVTLSDGDMYKHTG
jgi:hypothetical protein